MAHGPDFSRHPRWADWAGGVVRLRAPQPQQTVEGAIRWVAVLRNVSASRRGTGRRLPPAAHSDLQLDAIRPRDPDPSRPAKHGPLELRLHREGPESDASARSTRIIRSRNLDRESFQLRAVADRHLLQGVV